VAVPKVLGIETEYDIIAAATVGENLDIILFDSIG